MDCWYEELDKASNEDEVLRSATDYLQLWAPRQLDPMNLGLIELRIESGDDIERVRRSLKGSASLAAPSTPQAAHLRELATYFGHAATRMRELRIA